MIIQYQLYYKQTLVCETTSEYELHQYFLTHYHEIVWKPNNQKVSNRKITTLPDYDPAELINLLYSDKLVDYQLNFQTTHTEHTKFSVQGIGLKDFLQQQVKSK